MKGMGRYFFFAILFVIAATACLQSYLYRERRSEMSARPASREIASVPEDRQMTDVIASLQADDLCALGKVNLEGRVDLAAFVLRIASNDARRSDIPEKWPFLFIGGAIPEQPIENADPWIRYFDALMKANLFGSVNPTYAPSSPAAAIDAIRVLDELEKQDKGNGIYGYFRLPLRLTLATGVEEELLKLEEAQRFEAPEAAIARMIETRGLKSPATFLLAIEVLGRMRAPNYLPSFRIIQKAVSRMNGDRAEKWRQLGERMMATSAAASSRLGFLAHSHTYGNAIAREASRVLGGEDAWKKGREPKVALLLGELLKGVNELSMDKKCDQTRYTVAFGRLKLALFANDPVPEPPPALAPETTSIMERPHE